MSRIPPQRDLPGLGPERLFPIRPEAVNGSSFNSDRQYGLQYDMKDPPRSATTSASAAAPQLRPRSPLLMRFPFLSPVERQQRDNALTTEIRNGAQVLFAFPAHHAETQPRATPVLSLPRAVPCIHSLQVGLNRRFGAGLQLQLRTHMPRTPTMRTGVFAGISI